MTVKLHNPSGILEFSRIEHSKIVGDMKIRCSGGPTLVILGSFFGRFFEIPEMSQNHLKSIVYHFKLHTKQLFELLRTPGFILIDFNISVDHLVGRFFENSEMSQNHPKSMVYYFKIHITYLFELQRAFDSILRKFNISLTLQQVDFSKILKQFRIIEHQLYITLNFNGVVI